MVKKVVLVTGGFDPLHKGHIEYFTAAKELGDHLVVGVNSDEWLTRKKSKPFMSLDDRVSIIKNLKMVDEVITFDDRDGSACNAIQQVLFNTKLEDLVIFANGGDRNNCNIPEAEVFKDSKRVVFAFGVGGDIKINSSSWILDNWKTQKTTRAWGYWKVLDDKGIIKVKELVIKPGCSLSDQKHKYRSEHWYVLSGTLLIKLENNTKHLITLHKNDTIVIEKGVWHKAINIGTEDCHIVEIQYGENCIEEDILRRD